MSYCRVNRILSRAISLALVFVFVLSQLSIAQAICLCDTPGAMACCATIPAPEKVDAADGCCREDGHAAGFSERDNPFVPVLAIAASACRLGIESSDLTPVAPSQTKTTVKENASDRFLVADLDQNACDTISEKAAAERAPPGPASRPIYERISSYLI